MKKYKVMDGNEACSYISYLFSELAGIYPITPASTMAEKVDELSGKGFNNLYGSPVKVIEMQSEAGAIALVHGALQAGTLATTYTASQGLLLMIPSMYKIAGECLPCVINVAARSIATHALSIMGDHQDVYAVRQTGFAMLASSNVQDVMNLTAVSYLSSLRGKVPFVNFFDGFRTSHELKKIEVLDGADLKYLIDRKALNDFKNNSMLSKTVIRGTTENDDIYFQNTEARNVLYDEVPDVVNDYMNKINTLTGKNYKPFNYYGSKNASKIIVAMGSVCDTIKEVIDNEESEIGLVEVHLYRPFSEKYFLEVIPKTVQKIAVLDRTKEAGSSGEPLYLDVCKAFSNYDITPKIIGGRYGLSGKNTTPSMIKAVYDFLDDKDAFSSFTVGIEDDLTNRSIKVLPYKIKNHGVRSILVYGYGSDGMVSASKDLITILGNFTDAFVQGYFEYDSKKSGGVTKSHLRVSKNDINSTYYVDKTDILVVTKDSYLLRYDVINKLKKNGTFVLVTSKTKELLLKFLPNDVKNYIKDNNIKFYVIDAFKIARENNINNKISAIIETVIFKIGSLVNYEQIKYKIKDQIKKRFAKKGNDIVTANLNAVDMVDDALNEIIIDEVGSDETQGDVKLCDDKVFNYVSKLEGNSLTVKDFISHRDGSFSPSTTKYEKRDIAEMLPCWLSENCIECNMCSLACPHGVIRPFVLTKEEVLKYGLGGKVIPYKSKEDLYFYMAISDKDCTGCGVCASVCPAVKKAIKMKDALMKDKKDPTLLFDDEQKLDKNLLPKTTIRGSQFKKPLFEFSLACAGCGQTPYLKLLTQLFGNSLVIANATGCSSIYGGSQPSMPYAVSWANSLFEDNAEFGLGIIASNELFKERIKDILSNSDLSYNNRLLADEWLSNPSNYEASLNLMNNFDYKEQMQLERIKEYIMPKTVWIVGGDGWAYDIGYGGLDHVLASGKNVNVLVLDTEVYSNTGGQASKSTRSGAIAKFSSVGKVGKKKDLARIFMSYENVYVASISLGGNMQQAINALSEAASYDGPSIVIAYAPCITHGIKSGMQNSINEEKLAVESGYFPIFRYNPKDAKLTLDYKNPDFDKYDELLENENRYAMLKTVNESKANLLLNQNKEEAKKRFEFYKNMSLK